jgi:hypothetical protein
MANLSFKTIRALRELAIKNESLDLSLAHTLMSAAYEAAPTSSFMLSKIRSYERQLSHRSSQEDSLELQRLVSEGRVAIIPVGLRCHTKGTIKRKLGIAQASLPFDSGFFSPYSVASVINNPIVEFDFENTESYSICIKYERYKHSKHGLGLRFRTASLQDIDSAVSNILNSSSTADITEYLDSTFGYYTLNTAHQFVLAHYNWHELAKPEKSGGCTDPKTNLNKINEILNRRIERMFDMCENAEFVFFLFQRSGRYNYIMIDESAYSLHDLNIIQESAAKRFDSTTFALKVSKNLKSHDLLKLLR